jgi:hypothetical protein
MLRLPPLIRGHSWATQCWIAFSLRSVACVSVVARSSQPLAQQPRHRWIRQRHPGQVPGWTAIRPGSIHSVTNLCASAPSSSARSIPSSSSSAIVGGRTARPWLPDEPDGQPAAGRLAVVLAACGGRHGWGCSDTATHRHLKAHTLTAAAIVRCQSQCAPVRWTHHALGQSSQKPKPQRGVLPVWPSPRRP